MSLGVAPDAWAMLHSQQRRTWETIERWIPPDPSRLPPGHDPFELSDALSHQLVREEVERVETTDKLVLCEGVESALSAALIYERPAWAKCSGFPAEIWLPEFVQDVLIYADHDAPTKNGRPRVTSRQRAEKLATFIIKTGRRCKIAMPKTEGWDANDVLLQLGGGA